MSDNSTLDRAKVKMIDKFLSVMDWLDGRSMIDVLMPFQREILYSLLATVRADGQLLYKRGLLHMAKKNGKSLLLILASMFVTHTCKPTGRKGVQVYYVASDEDQANDNLTFAKKLYKCNPTLAAEVSIKGNRIELKRGDGFIEILPAGDAAGMHGKSYRLLTLDELHTQKNYDVLEALEMDPSRPDAQQLFGSYSPLLPRPGLPIVDILRQHADGLDPRLFVFSRSGSIEAANPAMGGPLGSTHEEIEAAQIRLPSWHFRRLYLNLSGQAEGAAFDGNAVESCIAKGRKVLHPRTDTTYRGFVDMSGGGSDDSTLCIGHRSPDGQIVIDVLMDQGPRANGTFSPEVAVQRFAAVLKEYRCHQVTGDRYAGEWPREAFARHDIIYRLADLDRSGLYTQLEPLVNAGKVELLDNQKMIAQLVGLVRRGAKIDHPPGEHDDHCNAVAGVASLVKTGNLAPLIVVI